MELHPIEEDGYESDTGERSNPTCANFLEDRPIVRLITVSGKQKLFNRQGRAICRIMSAHGWKYVAIARIFGGGSDSSVARAVENIRYNPRDNVAKDYELVDPEFRVHYPPVGPHSRQVASNWSPSHEAISIGDSESSNESTDESSDESGEEGSEHRLREYRTARPPRATKSLCYGRLREIDQTQEDEDFEPPAKRLKHGGRESGQTSTSHVAEDDSRTRLHSSTPSNSYASTSTSVFPAFPAQSGEVANQLVNQQMSSWTAQLGMLGALNGLTPAQLQGLLPPQVVGQSMPPTGTPFFFSSELPGSAFQNALAGNTKMNATPQLQTAMTKLPATQPQPTSYRQAPVSQPAPPTPVSQILKTRPAVTQPPPLPPSNGNEKGTLGPFLKKLKTLKGTDLSVHTKFLEAQGFSVARLLAFAQWSREEIQDALTRIIIVKLNADLDGLGRERRGMSAAEAVTFDIALRGKEVKGAPEAKDIRIQSLLPPPTANPANSTTSLSVFLRSVMGLDLSAHKDLLEAQGLGVAELSGLAEWEVKDVQELLKRTLERGSPLLGENAGMKPLEVLALEYAIRRVRQV